MGIGEFKIKAISYFFARRDDLLSWCSWADSAYTMFQRRPYSTVTTRLYYSPCRSYNPQETTSILILIQAQA
jgi:hypothetical protein